MVKFKRVLAGVAAGAVIATQALFGVVQAAEATGFPAEFEEALQWGYENGLTSYNTMDKFMPYGVVTRQTAAKIFGEWAENVLGKTPDTTKTCEFNDIDQAAEVLRPYIVKACQLGLFNGDENGNFNPNAELTKSTALVLIVRALEGQKDENTTPWWKNYYEKAVELGITNDSMEQVASKPAYRIETMVMLYRASQDLEEDGLGGLLDELLGDGGSEEGTMTGGTATGGEAVVGADVLDVSISPDSPAQIYAPAMVEKLIVGKVDFQAGDADVELKRASFKLEGLVNAGDVGKVYLLNEDEQVVTTQRSFDDDRFDATVFFNDDDVVPANSVKSYYVAIDYMGDPAMVFNVDLTDVEVAGETEVQGAFPLRFATILTTLYMADGAEFEGDYDNKATTADRDVEVGDTNVMLGDFDIKVDTVSGRSGLLKSIKLKATSSIDGVIDNVRLEDEDGTVVASGADITIDGRYITFTIPGDGYEIESPDTITFEIYGDVVGGDEGDMIQFYLKDEKDVTIFEKWTDMALIMDRTHKYLEANKIIAPKNYISKSDETPAGSYIPVKTDNALVLVANFNVEDDMDVDSIKVNLAGDADDDDITSVKLRVDDEVIGDEDWASSVTFDFEDTLTKGAHKLYVYVDVDENAVEGHKVAASIDVAALADEAEYVNSDNTVIIDGSADGPTYTIKKPAIIAVARTDDASNNDVIIAGESNVELLKFKVAVNNIRDVELRRFKFTVSSGDAVEDVRVMYNGNEVGNVSLNDTEGKVTSLDVIIPKAWAAEFTLVGDIDADYSGYLQVAVNNFEGKDIEGVDVEYTGGVTGANFWVKDSSKVEGKIDNTDTPRTGIAIGDGSTEVEVLRFQLKAVDADARLEELTLVNLDEAFTGSEITGSVTPYTGADNVVRDVKLYDADGNLVGEAGAGLVDGVAYIPLSNPFDLTKDENTTFVVKVVASVNDVDKTNKYVRFGVLEPGYDIDTFVTKIVSSANNEDVTVEDGKFSIVGYPQYFRATIPTFATEEIMNDNAVNGVEYTVYRFSVTAADNENVLIKKLAFDVTKSDDGDLYDFELVEAKDDGSDGASFGSGDVSYDYSGGVLVVEFTGTLVDGYEITAGSTQKFNLNAKATGFDADTDIVNIVLDQKSNDLGVYSYADLTGDTAVVWSDNAGGDTELTDVDWFTDAELGGIPGETATTMYRSE